MFRYMERLLDERRTLTEAITRMADTAADEGRDLSDTERTSVNGMQTRCAELDAQINEGQTQIESARAFAGLMQRAESTPAPEQRGGGVAMERTTVQLSPGEGFIASPSFTEYRGVGASQRYEVRDYLDMRAAIATSDLNIQPFRWGGPAAPSVTTPFLDVINHVSVSSGVVEWVTMGADPVAAVVAEGAPKPEATITMTPASATLDTLAHWVQITRQALEDAAYIRSVIEGSLRRGLAAKAEADAAAAVVAATALIPDSTSTDLLKAIRVGIGTVQSNGYNPNAVLLNPADYADLDIAVMVESVDGPVRKQTFWGLVAVPAKDVPAGTAYVGDFQTAVTLFDRGVSNVFLTDSHASLFISNILVILAETRLKTAVTAPVAMTECTVAP